MKPQILDSLGDLDVRVISRVVFDHVGVCVLPSDLEQSIALSYSLPFP